jgi:hypothetical protein
MLCNPFTPCRTNNVNSNTLHNERKPSAEAKDKSSALGVALHHIIEIQRVVTPSMRYTFTFVPKEQESTLCRRLAR